MPAAEADKAVGNSSDKSVSTRSVDLQRCHPEARISAETLGLRGSRLIGLRVASPGSITRMPPRKATRSSDSRRPQIAASCRARFRLGGAVRTAVLVLSGPVASGRRLRSRAFYCRRCSPLGISGRLGHRRADGDGQRGEPPAEACISETGIQRSGHASLLGGNLNSARVGQLRCR